MRRATASRSLSETKRRYAQIEKEALAVTWSCEKFSDYIFVSRFEIETDDKPLVPLLSNKHLHAHPLSFSCAGICECCDCNAYALSGLINIQLNTTRYSWSMHSWHYILGSRFEIETDHKPLISLLSNKQLSDLPPRVLRFRLRMAKYNYCISHVPGKLLYTTDALSIDPIQAQEQINLQDEVETFVNALTESLPASKQRLDEYRQAQEQDETCSQVKVYCTTGWLGKQLVLLRFTPFWKVKDNLTICDYLLLYNSRIVVPKLLQWETLQKIHTGHLGIIKCKKRAATSVSWPGVMQQISMMVQNCNTCVRESRQRREPLMTTELSNYPWQVVGTDLFELNKSNYLPVVDFFQDTLKKFIWH